MPYIKQENRRFIDKIIQKNILQCIESNKCITLKEILPVRLSPGELNYIITVLIHNNIKDFYGNFDYTRLNGLIGILECAKSELYRMIIAKYEDKKRMKNGPISELDAKTLEDVR